MAIESRAYKARHLPPEEEQELLRNVRLIGKSYHELRAAISTPEEKVVRNMSETHQNIVEECEGCIRIMEAPSLGKICSFYPAPERVWKEQGSCRIKLTEIPENDVWNG